MFKTHSNNHSNGIERRNSRSGLYGYWPLTAAVVFKTHSNNHSNGKGAIRDQGYMATGLFSSSFKTATIIVMGKAQFEIWLLASYSSGSV